MTNGFSDLPCSICWCRCRTGSFGWCRWSSSLSTCCQLSADLRGRHFENWKSLQREMALKNNQINVSSLFKEGPSCARTDRLCVHGFTICHIILSLFCWCSRCNEITGLFFFSPPPRVISGEFPLWLLQCVYWAQIRACLITSNRKWCYKFRAVSHSCTLRVPDVLHLLSPLTAAIQLRRGRV